MTEQQRSWEMSDGNQAKSVSIADSTGQGADSRQTSSVSVVVGGVQGPRTITIHRSSAGFGFTLRHFIVYPPDPVTECPEEWQRCMKAGLLDPAAPMDTIFVKHVRESGPAALAGLATGDRVLSVNGEPVHGKSYAQVVQMIQRSGPALQLIVVPKEHDVLQQCFAETAHNPQSNIRTTATMVLAATTPPQQTTATNSSSLMSHLPRPKPYQPFPIGQSSSRTPPPSFTTTPTSSHPSRNVVRVSIPIGDSSVPAACDSRSSSSVAYDIQQPRSRASLAEYVPTMAPSIGGSSKRSSYAGPASSPSSRIEFMVSAASSSSPRLWSSASPRLEPPSSPIAGTLGAGRDVADSYLGSNSLLNSSHGSTNSLAAQRDSLTSSKGSLYSEVGDSVMNRIKKSFEQKEEFLKRPAVSYWPSEAQSPPVPKEFYAHPQKFPRPPWPPQETTPPGPTKGPNRVEPEATPKSEAPVRVDVETTPIVTSVEPWSMVFTSKRATPPESPATPPTPYLGLVPNSVPRPFYGSPSAPVQQQPQPQQLQQQQHGAKNFVSTLTRIQENIPADCMSTTHRKSDLELKLKCQPMIQAPLAEPEDFTPSPTKLTAPVPLAAATSASSGENKRENVSVILTDSVSKRAKQFEAAKDPATPSPVKTDPNALGERGLLSRIAQRKQDNVETKVKIPADYRPVSNYECARPGGSGNRTVIVGGGKLHCDPPAEFKQLQFENATEAAAAAANDASRKTVLRQNSYRSAVRSFNVSVFDVIGAVANAPPRTEATPTAEGSTAPNATPTGAFKENVVNKRPKVIYEDDLERGTRRVSYLKATAGDRLHVDTDLELSDHEADPQSSAEMKRRGDSRSQPHSINKLRSLFGEKVSHSASGTSLCLPGTVIVEPPKEQQPSPPVVESSREGWLYVKQTLVDHKRAADRSWKQLWGKIKNSSLYLYRDKKDAANASLGGEEHVIDLSGCSVEVALDYTKRKNVLRLKTLQNAMEYLLQCEDHNDMLQWLQVLQDFVSNKDVVHQNGGYSNSEMILRKQAIEMLEGSSHGSKAIRRFTAFHQQHRSPPGHSPVSKTRKQSLGEPPTSPNKPKTWKGKVVKQFKKIQGNSPSSPSHPQPPEGATFGLPLELCPKSTISENIPLIVELCVSIVEAKGLETVGVYRVPGNTAAVTALTESLNKGLEFVDLHDPRWNDINVISSLLKSFLRKLPEPLVTSESYSLFIEASKTEDENQRAIVIKQIIQELPDINYETLRFLVRHLARVARFSHANKMEPRNLAIVFGPTLIRSGDDSTVTMVSDMSHQCRIVETLIAKADWFFPPDSNEAEVSLRDSLGSADTGLDMQNQRKDVNAKDIVSSIISAACRKKTDDTDSPAVQAVPSSTRPSRSSAESSSMVTITGSLQSLADVASKGGVPALPSETAATVNYKPEILERKRSASLGGDVAFEIPVIIGRGKDSQSAGGGNPIDAAGIRSYSGLSAVTQERVRKFEQETKALLQRDLAKQRKDSQVQKLDKGELEKAWNQAKYEMETEDFYDSLADNPNEAVAKILHRSADHVTAVPAPGLVEIQQQGHQSSSCPHLLDSVKESQDSCPDSQATADEDPEVAGDQVKEDSQDSQIHTTEESQNQNEDRLLEDAEKAKDLTPKKAANQKEERVNSPDQSESDPVKQTARSHIPRFSPAKVNRPSTSTSSSLPSSSKTSTSTSKIPSKRSSDPPVRPSRSSLSSPAVQKPAVNPRTVKPVGEPKPRTKSVKTQPKGSTSSSETTTSPETSTSSTVSSRRSSEVKIKRSNSIEVKVKRSDEVKAQVSSSETKVTGSNSAEVKVKRSNSIEVKVKRSDEVKAQVSRSNSTETKVAGLNSAEVNKVKVKRSDSLTKDEKTESNTKARDKDRTVQNGKSRKVQSRTDSGLKRRHTVGGTRDFDKVRIQWLSSDNKKERFANRSAWERLQPLISDENLNVERNLKTWMKCERMRTSSPELCRRTEPTAVYPVLVIEN